MPQGVRVEGAQEGREVEELEHGGRHEGQLEKEHAQLVGPGAAMVEQGPHQAAEKYFKFFMSFTPFVIVKGLGRGLGCIGYDNFLNHWVTPFKNCCNVAEPSFIYRAMNTHIHVV